MGSHQLKFRVRSAGKICLPLAVAVLATLVLTPVAEAKRRVPSVGEFRFRASGTFGNIGYSDISQATNAKTEFSDLQPGSRVQIEAWHGAGVGLLIDSEVWYAGVSGRQVYFGDLTTALGWRLAGSGGGMGSETVLYAGPTMQWVPDIRSYPGRLHFDLLYAKALALTAGLKWRIAFGPNFTLEFGGSYTAPQKLVGTPSASLSRSESRTYGGTVMLDYRYFDGMGLGFGWMYSTHRLAYTPNGNPLNRPQTINYIINSPIVGIRFWF